MIEIKVTHVLDEFQFKTLVEMMGGAKVSPPLEAKPEEEYGDWVTLQTAADMAGRSILRVIERIDNSFCCDPNFPKYKTINGNRCIHINNLRLCA